MRVKVIKLAFYNGGRVKPGDVINVPDGTKAKWFEPIVEKVEKVRGKQSAKAPEPSGEGDGAEDLT